MRYTQFRFKNFKGIEEMTLNLSGPVTTLIGLNESGKTTILEAIFCFSYGAENLEVINPEMASLHVPDRWIPIGRRANFNDTIEICATVEVSDEDQSALRQHMLDDHGLKLVDALTRSGSVSGTRSGTVGCRNEAVLDDGHTRDDWQATQPA